MNSITQNNQINISMNVIKCIAVLAVICLHCNLYTEGTAGIMIISVSRFAVPFFFLISGFYSYYESRDYSEYKYKKRLIKILKLIIVANALFFIYKFIVYGAKAFPSFDLNSLINYFVFNVSPFAGHLWFLQALLYCYIIFYILNKINFNLKNLYVLIPILFIINLILGEGSKLLGFPVDYYYCRNFLFLGMPFFILGYAIHDKQEKAGEFLTNATLLFAIIFAILLAMLEPILTGVKSCDLYVGTIILSTLLFIWCVKNPQKLNLKVAAWIGGTLYTSIYILHLLIYYIFKDYLHYGLVNPLIVFVVTLLIGSLVIFEKV